MEYKDFTSEDNRRQAIIDRNFITKNFEYHIMKKYNLTAEQYYSILESQGGVCCVCLTNPKGKRLAVDHCHITGKVRGILCSGCNVALGHLKDDPENIQRLLNYITRFA